MSFATPKDRVYQLQLAAQYTADSGQMTLQSGQGANFTTFPIYFVAITAATYGTGKSEVAASYQATGKSGDTLTGVSVLSGSTDQTFNVGDYIEGRDVSQYVVDLNTATAAIQTALNSVPSGVLKGVDGVLEAATAGTDYVTPSGCVTSFTGDGTVLGNSGSTGSVTATLESQAKNKVLAGPSSGSNAAPTFRAIVPADLPGEYSGAISASISSNQNNWAPTGLALGINRIRINASATGTTNAQCPQITGIAYPSVADGQSLLLENVGTFPVLLIANSGSSSSGNQFLIPEARYMLIPGDSIILLWDSGQNGWLAVERSIRPTQDFFGSGYDGDVTASSGVQARQFFYRNLTLPSSIELSIGGYDIYVSEVLDLSNASASAIYRASSNGGNASGATGGSAGTAPSSAALGGAGGGTAGATATTGSGSSATATGTTASGACIITNGATSGTGGASGANTGGTGVSSTSSVSATRPYKFVDTLFAGGTTLLAAGSGGPGGGSGAGDSTNAGGGGGGGGAGGCVLRIFARVIYRGSNSTAAIIQAKGGTGGTGGNGAAGNAAGGGGGAGGAGGLIQIFYGYLAGSQITNAIDASGGAGGTGGNASGTGAGGQGGTQGTGGRIHLINMASGTLVETVGSSGTAGGSASGTTGGSGGSGTTTQVSL